MLRAEAQAKPSLPPSGDAPTANGLNGEPPHAHDASGPPPPLKPGLSIDAQLQLDEINAEINAEIDGAAPAPAFVDLSKVGSCAEGQLDTVRVRVWVRVWVRLALTLGFYLTLT